MPAPDRQKRRGYLKAGRPRGLRNVEAEAEEMSE